MKRLRKLAFVLGFILLGSASAYACPACKNFLSVENAAAELARRLATGYFWSILVMLAVPYLLTAGIGGLIYWKARQSRVSG